MAEEDDHKNETPRLMAKTQQQLASEYGISVLLDSKTMVIK